MNKFINWLDATASIDAENATTRWLERIAFLFLTLMVLAAPHSIAVSQGAWLCGMLASVIRFFFSPRPSLFKTPLNSALLLLLAWSVVSAVFSYAPDISIDKLRSVGLLFIFFFVVNNLRSKRAAVFLSLALITSCFVSAAWSPIERLLGRGVEIHGLNSASLLAKGHLEDHPEVVNYPKDGDTIIRVGKKKISSPEQLIGELEKNEITPVTIYRLDYDYVIEVKRADLISGNTATEKLGFQDWKRSHSWRSAGTFGHFTTYAEVLQLIAALTLGILVVLFKRKSEDYKETRLKIFLSVCLAAFALALLLTVTRASQAAFLFSSAVVVLLVASRKIILALAVLAIPLVLAGAYFLQQSRNVGFYDQSDNSITWRQTVYREGLNLAVNSPRHLIVGVGMDSIKRYAKDWHLFDDGKLPIGHFHSTPLQLTVERGIPAFLIWLWILWLYGNTLWKRIKIERKDPQAKIEFGIIVGCFGSLIGFFTSGLVHYNLGDGEVAMVFYLLMGIGTFMAKTYDSQETLQSE